MNTAAAAQVTAWQVIADQELPAGTKITVEDRWVTVHPRGGQPARIPYGRESSPESLYGAIRDATQATTRAALR